MSDSTSLGYQFEILLPQPVDGKEIETFITEKGFRSDENDVRSGLTRREKYFSGTSHQIIVVSCRLPVVGGAIVDDLLDHFGGILF